MFMNRELMRAWDKWEAYVEEVLRERELFEVVARKMRNRDLNRGWNSWLNWYDEVVRQQKCAKKVQMKG